MKQLGMVLLAFAAGTAQAEEVVTEDISSIRRLTWQGSQNEGALITCMPGFYDVETAEEACPEQPERCATEILVDYMDVCDASWSQLEAVYCTGELSTGGDDPDDPVDPVDPVDPNPLDELPCFQNEPLASLNLEFDEYFVGDHTRDDLLLMLCRDFGRPLAQFMETEAFQRFWLTQDADLFRLPIVKVMRPGSPIAYNFDYKRLSVPSDWSAVESLEDLLTAMYGIGNFSTVDNRFAATGIPRYQTGTIDLSLANDLDRLRSDFPGLLGPARFFAEMRGTGISQNDEYIIVYSEPSHTRLGEIQVTTSTGCRYDGANTCTLDVALPAGDHRVSVQYKGDQYEFSQEFLRLRLSATLNP